VEISEESQIRQELKQSPNVLISLTNDLLKSANEKLIQNGREQGLLRKAC